MTAAIGTPTFIAPEVIGDKSNLASYSLSSDVYSFAMVFLAIGYLNYLFYSFFLSPFSFSGNCGLKWNRIHILIQFTFNQSSI